MNVIRKGGTLDSAVELLRSHYVLTHRTLGPHSLGTVVFLVFDKEPRSRDTLAAVRTATER